MNKKAIYSILSTIVAMAVLSVSLVFAIGPRVSADEGGPVLVPTEYLNIHDGVLGDDSENSWKGGGAFTAERQDFIFHLPAYRVEVPEGVTSIANYAFYGTYFHAPNLITIDLPSSLTSIGNQSFEDAGLTSIKIPDSVTSIGEGAFHSCSSLVTVTLPQNLKTLGSAAFYNCTSLTSIEIPEGVTEIKEFTFTWCESLTSVILPSTLTKLDSDFCGCSSLTSITLPKKLTDVGSDLFSSCGNLKEIIVENENLLTNENLAPYASIMRYESPSEPEQPELTEPEIPVKENNAVNNKNNASLIWGIAGTAAGILIIGGVVVGIVISKLRRK